ncbi:MAG: hypothetical protein J0M00_08980 [Burkholderiales bacterium]|nr:hypothetical protein [Burkholderiales bacterium]
MNPLWPVPTEPVGHRTAAGREAAEIEAAPDPAAKRAELEAHYLDMTSPFRTAEKFGVLDIIDPRETRQVLCDWVEDAWHVVQGDLPGRHR